MERWSSGRTFLLAAIGSAVGIGNIWRFSSVVGQNGGGAYLVPYLVAVILFAMPLMILEFAVGRGMGKDVVSAFLSTRSPLRKLGWLIPILLTLLLSYYLVITGWTLAYAFYSLLGIDVKFSAFTSSLWPIATFVASALATGLVVSAGVRGGIEKISKILIPVVFIILVIMLLYSLTLSGVGEGFAFLFTPDFSVLGDPNIWSAAFGQAFFSLSVGFGILMTYGIYIERDVHIVKSTGFIALGDLMVALLAGMVIFPIVFTLGLSPTLGTELAFTTLPFAFERLPLGQLMAVLFFSLLFFAALTSSISMLEVDVTVLMQCKGWSRKRVTALLTAVVFLIGLLPALSYSSVGLNLSGIPILDLMDTTVGDLGLPISGLLISLVFAYHLDQESLAKEIGERWARPVLLLTRYLVPLLLGMVTALSVAKFLV
ncbi:MAG: sodium-dependent transporter [Methanomassiliicoccales archaeon]